MNREYEATYHVLEERHWWFKARRNAVRSIVRRLCPDRNANILEIGCSSGVLIHELQRCGYANVCGIDISESAVRASRSRGVTVAQVMDAEVLDFPPSSFDLITASDVLEHIDDDVAALREWHRVLKPDGRIIIFVPAFPGLWSEHDVANQHFRRYRLPELRQKAEAVGFFVERQSYWNAALFAPISLVRRSRRLRPLPSVAANAISKDLYPPAAPVNAALFAILSLENAFFLRGLNFPFGVSAMLVVRKGASARS